MIIGISLDENVGALRDFIQKESMGLAANMQFQKVGGQHCKAIQHHGEFQVPM
jgi:hypothetical protein